MPTCRHVAQGLLLCRVYFDFYAVYLVGLSKVGDAQTISIKVGSNYLHVSILRIVLGLHVYILPFTGNYCSNLFTVVY